MTQLLINFYNFNSEILTNLYLNCWSYISLSIVILLFTSGIYFSSSAKKTLIDIGTKVGTAVITGVAAGAAKSIVDKQLSEEDSEDKDKDKDKNKKTETPENQDIKENKQESLSNSK